MSKNESKRQKQLETREKFLLVEEITFLSGSKNPTKMKDGLYRLSMKSLESSAIAWRKKEPELVKRFQTYKEKHLTAIP